MRRWTIAVGNAFEGIKLHGVFDDCDKAIEYATRHFCNWDVIQIQDL